MPTFHSAGVTARRGDFWVGHIFVQISKTQICLCRPDLTACWGVSSAWLCFIHESEREGGSWEIFSLIKQLEFKRLFHVTSKSKAGFSCQHVQGASSSSSSGRHAGIMAASSPLALVHRGLWEMKRRRLSGCTPCSSSGAHVNNLHCRPSNKRAHFPPHSTTRCSC